MLYRLLYNCLICLALPFALVRLLWKSRKNPAYRQRLGERFAQHLPNSHGDVWLHAVSVGEFLAILPLVEKLLAEGYTLLVTTTTPTGSAMLKNKLGNRVAHCYLPFDVPLFAKRFMHNLRPSIAVFVETEIWPNFIAAANEHGIPTLLINARLSEKSARSYAKLGNFSKTVFAGFTKIACQNKASCRRFSVLAANAAMYGNLKFDLNPPSDLEAQQNHLRKYLLGRDFILAASTHAGEEDRIANSFRNSKFAASHVLVIAPRHPERCRELATQLAAQGFAVSCYAQSDSLPPASNILLLDQLGMLLKFYSLADWAIIGGSFVPHGGHNPLEAALFATPCVIGKHFFNFATLVDDMRHHNAIIVIAAEQLFGTVPTAAIGESAKQFLTANQGALQNYRQLICHNIDGNTK